MPRPTPVQRPTPRPTPRPAPKPTPKKRRSLFERAILGCVGVIVLAFVALIIFVYGIDPYSEWRCGAGAGESCAYLIRLRDVQKKPDEANKLRVAYQHVFVDGCFQGRINDCQRAVFAASGDLGLGEGPQAMALFARACELGEVTGCYELGTRTGLSDARSEPALQKACDQGALAACNQLAVDLADEKAPRQDVPRAVALLQPACSLPPGDAGACFNLGVFLFRGEGIDIDRPGATANFKRACSLGEKQGCSIVRELAAIEPIEAKCDDGDLLACQEVEPMFALGGRIPFSWKWASRYQARACALGSAQMCYRAGFQLKDLKRKPDEARAFFVRGCDMKYMAACEELALMETDVAKRLLLLRSACDTGSTKACAELGQRAATGNGVPPNAADALSNLDRACNAGDGDAPTCEVFWPLALESRNAKLIGRGLRGLDAGFLTGQITGGFQKLEAAKKELQNRCDRHENYACEALKSLSSP